MISSSARKKRPARTATVTAVHRLTPDLVRISFDCPELIGAELPHTDHYIKISFGEMVTRTYTFRRIDTATGLFDVDFVTHGDQGLAGPWAQRAQVGEKITFRGPGGAWHPGEDYEHFVFAGDESAAPAIAAGVEKLPHGATADVYLEIADADGRIKAIKGSIDHYEPGHAVLTGGERVKSDMAILATGWKLGVPFLPEEYRRKLIEPAQFAAGERLREDFELAQMGPRTTQNWERFLTPTDATTTAPRGPSRPASSSSM